MNYLFDQKCFDEPRESSRGLVPEVSPRNSPNNRRASFRNAGVGKRTFDNTNNDSNRQFLIPNQRHKTIQPLPQNSHSSGS